MKKLLLSVIFMTLGLCTFAEGDQYFFNIGEKGGDVALSIAFDKSPVLTYAVEAEGPVLVVTAEGVDATSFALDKQYTITYTESETPTSVKEAVAASKVRLNGGVAIISGLKAGETVSVFAPNGAQIASTVADNAGVATVSFSAMPKGVAVIKAGSASFKVKK